MSYDRESYYLTWGGTLFQAEQWQCGMKHAGDLGSTITQGTLDTIEMADIWAALDTWFKSGSTGAQIGSGAKLAWVKLAVLDKEGQYKFEPKLYQPGSASIPPQTTVYPAQVAYVVSLWSGQKLGRANHGRFYVPVPSTIVGQNADGMLTQANADQMRTAAKTMINAVKGEISTITVPTSPFIMSKIGTGTSKLVSSIGVGRVLDTQRRRRSALNEGTVYSAL